MEILNTLYDLMVLIFVLGTIISMGLSLTVAQITVPLRNARFIIVVLLANFVVVPAAAYILMQFFALDESLAAGLLLVSLAAGAPGLPKMVEFAKVDTAAATSLMVLLVVVTIVIMPAAMVVATMNFGNDEIVMVVVYALIGLVVMTPLSLELGNELKHKLTRKRRQTRPQRQSDVALAMAARSFNLQIVTQARR